MADEVAEENPRKKIRLDEPARPTQSSENSAENSAETDAAREMRLGITSYTNRTLSGFSGILKQRYTDFLVNEIPLSGKVLHLENIGGPENPVDPRRNDLSNAESCAAIPAAEEKVAANVPLEV
jgi:tRNA pseudouridine13 synthase